MQRSTATFLLFVAVAGAAVVAVATRCGVEPAPPDAGGAVAAPPPVEPARDAGRSSDPVPSRGVHVRVEVELRERFVAPPLARVAAVDGLGRPLPTIAVAGTGAGFDDGPARAGVALVAIGIAGGGSVLRTVAVAEEGIAQPVVGPRIVVRGVVRDAQRRPLPGARVWFGERDAHGVHRDAATADDGTFEIDVPAGTGVPFVAAANGSATTWQPIEIAAPPAALAIALPVAVPLAVQFATSSDVLDGARAFVVPHGAVSTELAQYPFFLQALTDGLAIDPNGSLSLPDLPAHGEIGIVVRHPRLPAAAPHVVALAKAAGRAVVPLGAPATVLRGRVVDDAGAPLAGAAVWTRAADRSLSGQGLLRLVPPHVDVPGTCFQWSDADGAFAIGALDGSRVVLSLRAPGRAGRDLPWPISDEAAIVLPAWRGGEPSFRLQPPRPDAPWSADVNLAGGVREMLAKDAPWVVSFPCAGRFDVAVTTLVDGVVVGTTRVADVAVTGAIDLQPPRAP